MIRNSQNIIKEIMYSILKFAFTKSLHILLCALIVSYSPISIANQNGPFHDPAISHVLGQRPLTDEVKNQAYRLMYADMKSQLENRGSKRPKKDPSIKYDATSVHNYYDCIVDTSLLRLWNSERFVAKQDNIGDVLDDDSLNTIQTRCFFRYRVMSVPDGPAVSSQRAEAKFLAVSDVLLDYGVYENTVVNVHGYLLILGSYSFLYEEQGSTLFLAVDIQTLPREDRNTILKKCGTGCAIALKSRVGDVAFQKGITAISLE